MKDKNEIPLTEEQKREAVIGSRLANESHYDVNAWLDSIFNGPPKDPQAVEAVARIDKVLGGDEKTAQE